MLERSAASSAETSALMKRRVVYGLLRHSVPRNDDGGARRVILPRHCERSEAIHLLGDVIYL